MRYRPVLSLVLFSALIVLAIAGRGSSAAQDQPAARVPVVVELFTSEGCSSCPPADALLARLARTQPVTGAEIIPLKLHVDYWNQQGWTDPFSSHAFSLRQARYAGTLGSESYTPQMVVDGRAEFVGSAEAKALRAISEAARAPKSPVELHASVRADKALTVEVRLPALAGRTPGEAADVFLAITEDNLHSDVKRGENAGRSFDHIAVVRSLRSIVRVRPGQQGDVPISVSFALDPAWRREELHAVVFVQEEKSRRILSAATLSLAP